MRIVQPHSCERMWLLWSPHIGRMDPPTRHLPKLWSWCPDQWGHTHTREHRKAYYSHDAASEEGSMEAGPETAWESRDRGSAWGFHGRAGPRVLLGKGLLGLPGWTFPRKPRERAPGVPYQPPRCGTEGGEWWHLEAVSSQALETKSNSLLPTLCYNNTEPRSAYNTVSLHLARQQPPFPHKGKHSPLLPASTYPAEMVLCT